MKTNLMIFIRAKIMRDSIETSIQTNDKYNLIRDVQQRQRRDSIQLMPGRKRPVLPPIDEMRSPRADVENDGNE
jgi:type II secretory pathway component GspD/PulD (secretin)